MNNRFRIRFGFSCSDNRKPKNCTELSRSIENPKWLGVVGILVLIFGCVGMVEAQQPKKVPRIGYLAGGNAATESTRAEGIRLTLRERGYVEGQNIAIEYRYTEGKADRYPELVAELVRLKVDLILVTGSDPLIRAAIHATKMIPIVLTGGGRDPVEAGYVESLARPGGNVTGITNLSRELSGKRLELLKAAVPKLARVAVLYDPGVPGDVLQVKEVLPVAARALKLTLQLGRYALRTISIGFLRRWASSARMDSMCIPRAR